MITKQQLQNQINELHKRIHSLEFGCTVYERPSPLYMGFDVHQHRITQRELMSLLRTLAGKCGYSIDWEPGIPEGYAYNKKGEPSKVA